MANEKRLIDANALVPYLWVLFKFFGSIPCTEADKATQRGIKRCIGEIEQMPTVDAVEVEHGRSIRKGNEMKCSKCKFIYYSNHDDFNYCPNCGAKMDGESKDNGNA